jgi:hypothetical protein
VASQFLPRLSNRLKTAQVLYSYENPSQAV